MVIEIGALAFPTKKDAAEHFRAMLYRYELGASVTAADMAELSWLLERHPEVDQKVGPGVEGFAVRSALYGTRCFEVIRTDGTRTDFSCKTCLDGKTPSATAQAMQALRAEVTSDILARKREWFRQHGDAEGKVPCALTGERITIEEAHADHAPPRPFSTLAVTFLKARGIDPDPAFVTIPDDNQYEPRIADPQIAQAWRSFHHDLAAIRIVAKAKNLALSGAGRVRKKDKQLNLSPTAKS